MQTIIMAAPAASSHPYVFRPIDGIMFIVILTILIIYRKVKGGS